MKTCILSFFLIFSCLGSKNSATINEKKINIVLEQHKKVNLEQNIIYKKNDTVVIILNKLRYKLLDIRLNNSKRILLIQKNNKTEYKIDLLTQEDYEGFSINWIKDINDGFEISIELGKYYYERNFQFIFRKNTFFLEKIETKSFEKNSNNNLKINKEILDEPIRIDFFDMKNYIRH